MKSIKSIASFNQSLLDRQAPDPRQVEQFKKLLELTKLYRQYEEAWFEKIRRKEFAVNQKDKMMDARRKLDHLIQSIQL